MNGRGGPLLFGPMLFALAWLAGATGGRTLGFPVGALLPLVVVIAVAWLAARRVGGGIGLGAAFVGLLVGGLTADFERGAAVLERGGVTSGSVTRPRELAAAKAVVLTDGIPLEPTEATMTQGKGRSTSTRHRCTVNPAVPQGWSAAQPVEVWLVNPGLDTGGRRLYVPSLDPGSLCLRALRTAEQRHGYRPSAGAVFLVQQVDSADLGEQGARSLRVLVVASVLWLVGIGVAIARRA